MSAGRKESPEKSALSHQLRRNPDKPVTELHKNTASHTELSTKTGNPERKVEFAQGTVYRQGVRVANGPQKSPMPRARNR
jgi:hypothetical protein